MVTQAMVNTENYFMNMHVELPSNVHYFHVLNFFGLYQFVLYDGLFSMNARLQDGEHHVCSMTKVWHAFWLINCQL
jgi:hypothetical protein